MNKPKDIDDYISLFPGETQAVLQELRAAIMAAAPGAEAVISYAMPGFKLGGMLVWFAAYKAHIGFYPVGSGTEEFREAQSGYKVSRGTVQFPLDRPLPLGLITGIAKFRVEQNRRAAAAKR